MNVSGNHYTIQILAMVKLVSGWAQVVPMIATVFDARTKIDGNSEGSYSIKLRRKIMGKDVDH